MAKVKRILLECTNTYQSDMNTGIQRVVRNIINNSPKISKELNAKCIPVITTGRDFLAIEKIKTAKNLRSTLIVYLKNVYRVIKKKLEAIFPILKKKEFPFITHLKLLLIDLINCLLFLIFSPVVLLKYLPCKVNTKKGDILLLLDSSWIYPIWPAVKKAKKNGATVGLVLYDLIPLLGTEFAEAVQTKRFLRWFNQSTKYVDYYIAISQTVRDELKDYFSQNLSDKKESIGFDYFKLGSVIDMVEKEKSARKELKDVFENSSNSNTYLTVGTIEPRKNHDYLLDVFDEVWKQCHDVRLCIIGRAGWACEKTIERINNHKLLGKNLFMFNDASDTELAYCYANAKSLIFPSKAEGYGLPIIEGIHNKLPVFASDIQVHQEVGGEFCTYFDISNSENLSNIIINIEKTNVMPAVKNPENHKTPTWEDSCRELLTKAVVLTDI